MATIERRTEPTVVSAPCAIDSLQERPRILFLRQDRIGDVLVSIPVIRAVRHAYPDAEIDVLLGENNIGVEHAVKPYVTNVLMYEKSFFGMIRTLRRIRRRAYDVIIDCMDNASATSSVIVRYGGSAHAVGIDKENRMAYTHVVPLLPRSSVHIVERLSMLLLPFGIDPKNTPLDLEYSVRPEERSSAMAEIAPASETLGHLYVGVNISGSGQSRMYPEHLLVHALRTIHSEFDDVRLFIFSAPHHAELRERIAGAVGVESVPSVSDFHAFACRLSCMDALITVDTSIVHLAAAWKTPSVVLFVHDKPSLMPWYPYAAECWPVETTTISLADIAVTDVVDAIRSMLRTFSA